MQRVDGMIILYLPICTSSMCSIKSANRGNVIPQPLNLQMFIMKTAIVVQMVMY